MQKIKREELNLHNKKQYFFFPDDILYIEIWRYPQGRTQGKDGAKSSIGTKVSREDKRKALWGGRPFTGEYSRGTDDGYSA